MSKRTNGVLSASDAQAIARMFNTFRKKAMMDGKSCEVSVTGPFQETANRVESGNWVVPMEVVANLTMDTENKLSMAVSNDGKVEQVLTFDSASPQEVSVETEDEKSNVKLSGIRKTYGKPMDVPFYASESLTEQPKQEVAEKPAEQKAEPVQNVSQPAQPAKTDEKSKNYELIGVSPKSVKQKQNKNGQPYRSVGFAYPKAVKNMAYFNMTEKEFQSANSEADIEARPSHTLHIPLSRAKYSIGYRDDKGAWVNEFLTPQEIYESYEANRQTYKERMSGKTTSQETVEKPVEQPSVASSEPVVETSVQNMPQSAPVAAANDYEFTEADELGVDISSTNERPLPANADLVPDTVSDRQNLVHKDLPKVADVMEQQEAGIASDDYSFSEEDELPV